MPVSKGQPILVLPSGESGTFAFYMAWVQVSALNEIGQCPWRHVHQNSSVSGWVGGITGVYLREENELLRHSVQGIYDKWKAMSCSMSFHVNNFPVKCLVSDGIVWNWGTVIDISDVQYHSMKRFLARNSISIRWNCLKLRHSNWYLRCTDVQCHSMKRSCQETLSPSDSSQIQFLEPHYTLRINQNKYCRMPFLVPQLVTSRGLMPVSGRSGL